MLSNLAVAEDIGDEPPCSLDIGALNRQGLDGFAFKHQAFRCFANAVALTPMRPWKGAPLCSSAREQFD